MLPHTIVSKHAAKTLNLDVLVIQLKGFSIGDVGELLSGVHMVPSGISARGRARRTPDALYLSPSSFITPIYSPL